MYYGDCYKGREHLKYLVLDKRIILKLSSLGYGKRKVNKHAERGGKYIGVTRPKLETRCQRIDLGRFASGRETW